VNSQEQLCCNITCCTVPPCNRVFTTSRGCNARIVTSPAVQPATACLLRPSTVSGFTELVMERQIPECTRPT
jgi:hypothetical protein